jgi:hypothetical protein
MQWAVSLGVGEQTARSFLLHVSDVSAKSQQMMV